MFELKLSTYQSFLKEKKNKQKVNNQSVTNRKVNNLSNKHLNNITERFFFSFNALAFFYKRIKFSDQIIPRFRYAYGNMDFRLKVCLKYACTTQQVSNSEDVYFFWVSRIWKSNFLIYKTFKTVGNVLKVEKELKYFIKYFF